LGKNNLPLSPFRKGEDSRDFELLSLEPRNIRLAACKQSWDGKALIIRLHEAAGIPTKCRLAIHSGRHAQSKAGKMAGGESESILYLDPLKFKPYEIKTIRLERSGKRREVALIEEQ
jgi:alpha-mannosidase